MQTLYKLTNKDSTTRAPVPLTFFDPDPPPTLWGEGVTHKATGPWRQPLCTNGWIHAYEHPLLAVLLNPIHGRFPDPILWEARGKVGKRDGPLKCGCRKLTTVRKIDPPAVTPEQRVRFAILCAKEVCPDPAWNKWADAWLSGKNRGEKSAQNIVDRPESYPPWSGDWNTTKAARTAADAAVDFAAGDNPEYVAAKVARETFFSNNNVDIAAIAEKAVKPDPRAKRRRSSARKKRP